jgi:hypothetical protein
LSISEVGPVAEERTLLFARLQGRSGGSEIMRRSFSAKAA